VRPPVRERLEVSVFAIAASAAGLGAGAAAWYGLPRRSAPLLARVNQMAAGLAPQSVRICSHEVRYLAGGAGPTVLLLHGIFGEKDHWVDFARRLTRRWRVIVPDLPGYGQSTRLESESYDYAAQTARLEALLDALGLAQVHIAGNSMGGTLAALLALRRPAQVASVAFVGAPHGLASPQPSEMDRQIDAGRAPLVVRDPDEFDAMLKLLFARRPFLPYPILWQARADAIERADSNLRLWFEQLRDRYLLQDVIGGVRAPVAVFWGERDRLFDVSAVDGLRARLPSAEVQVLPGLGHLPMMEAPRATAAAYLRFLESLP
jgi:abhydrolase domain-containing protein 6